MKKSYFLFFALSCLLFVNCKNDKTTPANTTTATPSVKTAADGFYKHLKGTVDTFAVTMDLVQIKSGTNYEPNNYRGYYYYDKYQQPIAFYGEMDSVGNIVLHEANWQDKDIFFQGKLDANGSFSGTWRDTSRQRTLPFTLKETYSDGAIGLDFHDFRDSLKLWKNSAKSPMAEFDMQCLLPSKNVEADIATFLKDKIFMNFKGDSLEKSYANVSVENLRNAIRDTFFASYSDMLAQEKPDSTVEVPTMLNYAESTSLHILFNEKGLLSVGYGTYSYTGGAHGNHATSLATYDLRQKKALTLNDVFLPKYEKTINKALVNAVRRQFDLKATEPLSNKLFENSVESTSNFCITPKGILFLYNPYEIAAYAYGEIELFIPFSEIKSVVNPKFL